MQNKIIENRHIREQLETDYQKKYNRYRSQNLQNKGHKKYRGLGLNWRDAVISILVLFFVGLYQVQAHAQDYCDLDDIDTSAMLSYHEQGNNYAPLKLLSSQYKVSITGIVAEVTINQTFLNDTSDWIKEGLYAFPVAHNAAVHQMKLIIGKRIIEGEIHEKNQAQQIYDDAKAQGQTASLVKQYRPNLFTTDVSNIMPNEKIQVQITYQQTLLYDAGHIDFRLPLAIKNRFMQEKYLADLTTTNLQEADPLGPKVVDTNNRSIEVTLEAGFELSEIKSLYHDVAIEKDNHLQLIRLNDPILYDKNDFVLRWTPTAQQRPQAALFSEKFQGEEYVLMMLLPPQTTQKIQRKREVVFIIDTSGSMHGEAMDAAKDALYFGLTQLQDTDKFNIIEFNSLAKELFSQSVIATPDNLDLAIDFIDALKSDGGTNMGPALKLAMKHGVDAGFLKQIIFVTDGSVGNEAQLFRQINQEIDQARLFTVAIGSAPNNYFMNKAALIGRGSYTNIGNLQEVDESMNDLFIKLSSPALTDVVVEWNQNVIQNPQIIPDLYSDQPVIITAKMPSFDRDIVLSGFAGQSTFSQEFRLNQDGQSSGIAKLWARNQIDDLTDDYMLGVNNTDTQLQYNITQLALKYHLVSDFTSLVAVDKTPEMSRLVQLQAQALNQNQSISQLNFPQTALGWKAQLLLGLIFVLMALVSQKIMNRLHSSSQS